MFAIRQIIDDPQDVIAIPPQLRQRRTALISAAVTGKIDVRGLAGPESSSYTGGNS